MYKLFIKNNREICLKLFIILPESGNARRGLKKVVENQKKSKKSVDILINICYYSRALWKERNFGPRKLNNERNEKEP